MNEKIVTCHKKELIHDEFEGKHEIMFRSPQPDGVLGCPMGRGNTFEAALADFKRRVEIESPVIIEFD